MIGSLWSFVKRHKKKFIFLSTVSGGGWLLYKYVLRKVQEIRDEEEKQYRTLFRRQHHFDSNQRTCNTTVIAMVSNIRDVLTKTLDTESVKDLLKSNPSNKLDLWEELKIMSLTRALAAVYGCCVLSVMLRVQLNLMGGYLYLDSLKQPTNGHLPGEEASIPQKVQGRYLALVKRFVEQGLPDFINYLRLAVTKEIGSIPLKERLRLGQVEAVLGAVRERVECGVDTPTQALTPYLLASETVPDLTDTALHDQEDQLLEKLISETRDVFESQDFHSVLRSSLDRGIHRLMDGLAQLYKDQAAQAGDNSTGLHEWCVPLARLVPAINSLALAVCADAPNAFVQELLLMEELKHLAANVYEAFSQPGAGARGSGASPHA